MLLEGARHRKHLFFLFNTHGTKPDASSIPGVCFQNLSLATYGSSPADTGGQCSSSLDSNSLEADDVPHRASSARGHAEPPLLSSRPVPTPVRTLGNPPVVAPLKLNITSSTSHAQQISVLPLTLSGGSPSWASA